MLVTLTDIKNYLGISGNSEDAFLTLQCQIASDAVELYCRRKFAQADYVETFYTSDFPISKDLKLYHFPVKEIISIKLDGEDFIPADLGPNQKVRLNKGSGILYRDSGFFANGVELVVTYKAGYDPIPNLIRMVVISIVEERYNKKKAGIPLNFGNNVQRMSIPGTISIDFDYSLTTNEEGSELGTILGSYQNVLVPYRSERTIIGTGRAVFLG